VINPDAVGRISSPGFPKDNYGNKLNCKLVLKVPSFKEIELITEYADIPGKYYLSLFGPEYVGTRWGHWGAVVKRRGPPLF
jgi:hypothetical protein